LLASSLRQVQTVEVATDPNNSRPGGSLGSRCRANSATFNPRTRHAEKGVRGLSFGVAERR
jgi:hypothetical protein